MCWGATPSPGAVSLGFWILRGLQLGPPKLQRLPRGGRRSWEQWWAQRPGAENAAARGAPAWRRDTGLSLLQRGSREVSGIRANGTDVLPRLGPLTFLLRKKLAASKSRSSPVTQNSWHLRPGPPRPEEASGSGWGTMGHCVARGLPDRKPGPTEPSVVTPLPWAHTCDPNARCGLASFS